MNGIITAIYEKGILRPLTPLSLPEHARVQIQIIEQAPALEAERQQVRQALIKAGVIQPRLTTVPISPVSEEALAAAAEALGAGGPLSELIITEREGR